jgi:ribulose-5-phosphate 4-epimerase/fuculose-1-phosphate aldolase
VRFDGSDLERADEYETPTELPIHGEIYRARNDVKAVVHAHPRASMLCSILRLELRPIFGAFDPASMKLGAMGVPVFPRSALVRDREMGQQLASTLGYKPVCLMYGHGIVSTGASVQEATITAIKLETLASLTLECAKTGIQPEVIGEEDRLYFQRLKETQSVDATAHSKDVFNWTWRHYTKLLEAYERRGN